MMIAAVEQPPNNHRTISAYLTRAQPELLESGGFGKRLGKDGGAVRAQRRAPVVVCY
jgi:hypothetical protein